MSRRSVLVTVGILVLVAAGALTVLALLLSHEPNYYRKGALAGGAAGKKNSREFLQQFSQLVSGIKANREWGAQITDDQINGYFVEAFRTSGIEEQILPDDIHDPRVRIEPERVRLGFRYGSGWLSTIITIDLRAWVAAGESNVVALELQGMHAGALPISAQSLLEHVSEAARRQNVEVTWYRHKGNPVALLRFQARRARTTVQLQRLELQQGKMLIHGRSIDPSPARPSVPAG